MKAISNYVTLFLLLIKYNKAMKSFGDYAAMTLLLWEARDIIKEHVSPSRTTLQLQNRFMNVRLIIINASKKRFK